MRKFFIIAISVFLSSIAGLPVEAAGLEPLYQIEVIIYSHINEEALRSEYWPQVPVEEIPAKAVELTDDQIVPPSQRILQSTSQLLNRENYSMLWYGSWRESATDLRKGKLYHLSRGNIYENNLHQINGVMSFRLEHYFNVHFNLQFILPWEQVRDLNIPTLTPPAEDHPYLTFKIDESLRMRSNELNNIDHPLYGILIQISPVTAPSST